MKSKTPNLSTVNWKQSIAVRFAIVWAVVLGGAVGFAGWLAHRDARLQLMENLRQKVEQDAGVIDLRLNTWLRTLGEDARSASKSPLVTEFLDARNSPDETRWRALMEDGFRAVFAGKTTYTQMRILQIGGSEEGREMIRLDRRGEDLVVTPPEQLQQKGGRSYFQEALSVPDGQVYFSEINLNRDFGVISHPHVPTIRAAIKIKDSSGRQAMLIINADLRLLFSELQGLASQAAEIYLADEKGDFLMHPDQSLTFSTDLGNDTPLAIRNHDSGLSTSREIPAGHWPKRVLSLKVMLSDESWRPQLEQSRWRGIWTTLLAALAGAALALLIAWPFARRLGGLSKALRRFDGTGDSPTTSLGDPRNDEIGIAIKRFQEMAEKVGEHVDDLRRARQDAEDANAAKETFLAVMSHEIRTPMNAVIGLIRALETNHPPDHQRPILDSLKSSTDNLMTLLNTALDFTRLHEGTMDYAKECFDATPVGHDVVAAMKPLAMAKNLALTFDSPVPLYIEGDPVRLRQVLNNLLNNALKFTEKGSITCSLSHDDGNLVGVITDTGPGIPEEDRAKIFAPFFTRTIGVSAQASGAGLGLSVSKELIEQQGGSLTLSSPKDGGAIFTFTLPCPLLTNHKELENRPHNEPRLEFNNTRILYVEDTLLNQEVMALTLAGTGIQLTFAGTAAAGLETFVEGEFDLVMVDLQLPDLPGTELAIRILRRCPDLPVIAVTAQSSSKTDELLTKAGIVDVILKPYTKTLVLEVLARHLPTDFAKDLQGIHPDNPEQAARLASLVARGFREAAAELQKLSARGMSAELDEARRAARHRFTTALALFRLHDLKEAFDKVGQNSEQPLIAALEETARQMEQSP